MQRTKVIQTGIVVLSAVIFFIVLFFGISTGKNAAISNIVIQNTKQLALGFQYFKADQDRFPSEFEFANQDLMSTYFNVFPPANIPSTICPENFTYQSPDQKGYLINFCLPKAVQSYHQGWNNVPQPSSLE